MRKLENPDKFRQNICAKLNELVQDEKKSRNMEKGVYNYALKEAANRKVVKKWDNPYFVQIYVDRLRSIFINLKNPALLSQIQSGALKSSNIAFMTHQEMMPEKWDAMIQDKIKRDKNKYETTIEAATDTFKSPKVTVLWPTRVTAASKYRPPVRWSPPAAHCCSRPSPFQIPPLA